MERSRIAGLWFVALFVACGPGGGGGGEVGNLDVPGQDKADAGGVDSHDPGPGMEIGDEFGFDFGGPEAAAPGECSKELNPACEPKDCKIPDGTAGKCAKDANGECACVREEPPQDPCGADLNPQCEPRKCPIAPNVDGLCALDPATGQCTCGGGAVEDPCTAALNPECKPEACKLPDGSEGKCLKDFQGLCGCSPAGPGVDPCDEATLNPNCVPRECDDGKPETSYDRCRWVVIEVGGAPLDTCQCAGDTMPEDPCEWLFNPECKPADCKLATGAVGKCQKDEKLGCSCQPEVVPVDPCGKDLNPKCEPKECPLPDGGVGTCRMDAAGACGCAPFLPPQDPCGKEQNPECKVVECDDGNPATVKDACRWVEDPLGLKYCKCLGEYVPYDPCDLTLNPECKPADCKLVTGAVGKCQKDEKLGCSCQPEVVPVDPCSAELNPQCEPRKCAIAPNVDGLCALDPLTGKCSCGGGIIPDDPCSPVLNPECKQAPCDDGNPLTQNDQCQWVKDPLGFAYCGCVGQVIVQDPCWLIANPECKPVECRTASGAPGKCNPDVLFGCSCMPSQEDPCGSVLNPKCEAVACDDGDPATEKDACRWVISPFGLQTCACQGQPVVFDPCDLFFNPACKPEACTTEKGAPGKCGWTVNNGCDCVGSTTQCTTDKDCLVLDWLVDCVGHWDCLDGQCQPMCGKPCGDGFCDATEGEGPQTCPVDCQKCADNTECSKTEYCAKANGDCNGTGQCEPRPTLCPLVFKPVCGCDGVTYQNSCEAHHAGVNVLHAGACDS